MSRMGIAITAAVLAFGCAPAASAASSCSLQIFTMPVTMEGARASVPVKVNGKETRFWLDTGAWFSIMSQAKADELNLKADISPYNIEMVGIGGSFHPKQTRIKDFEVSGSMLHNVDFLVGGSDSGNGLIGRNILASADSEFDFAHGAFKLVAPSHCDSASMAYWAPGKPFFTVRLLQDREGDPIRGFGLPVTINKTEARAIIDSGAQTILSRSVAERAGIDLNGPGVEPLTDMAGFGRHFSKGWLVPVESVGVGEETILHVKLVVIDGPITAGEGSPEMLLGMDFLLAHHLYVARGQHKIYFTYSGGNPFPSRAETGAKLATSDPTVGRPATIPAGKHRVDAVEGAPAPTGAEDFARRGAARLARNEVPGAIADLTEAIRLAPDKASYFRRRAEARLLAGDSSAARTDIDEALRLAPDDAESLRIRAFLLHAAGNDSGALADAHRAKALTPAGSLDLDQVAFLLDELGQAREAVPMYDAIIASHAQDARLGSLLNGRCWARALANFELDAALADCNRALKLNPNSSQVLDSRALVEFRKGDFQVALADYNAVLKVTPNSPWSLYMRGLTRIAMGDAQEGSAERDSALQHDPKLAIRDRYYGLSASRRTP